MQDMGAGLPRGKRRDNAHATLSSSDEDDADEEGGQAADQENAGDSHNLLAAETEPEVLLDDAGPLPDRCIFSRLCHTGFIF